MFVIFIWAVVKQGNVGPLWHNPVQTSNVELSGSEVRWIMLWMTTRGIGSWASGILYQSGLNLPATNLIFSWYRVIPDFTRYAKRPNDQFYGQIFVFPIISSCANIFGIIATSCARGFYPDEPLLWYSGRPVDGPIIWLFAPRKLYDFLYAIQRHEGNKARVAVFFGGFAFFLSSLSTAVATSID